MFAPLNDLFCSELCLYSITVLLIYNGCVKAFIYIPFVSDLSYIYVIDQNVMYASTVPVSLWPEPIYSALYFAQTPKLLIKVIDMLNIRRSLLTYL